MRDAERASADSAMRDLAVVDHAERVAGLGSWEWTPATGELLWSDNLFRLYGLDPGAVVPSVGYVVDRVHPSDRERVEATLGALSAGEARGVEYRFCRGDGTVRVLRATVAVSEDVGVSHMRVVGSVQDVTEQRRLEREVAARIAVTEALEGWRFFSPGAEDLLAGLGSAMGFWLGAFWTMDEGSLAARALWHRASPALEWVAATMRTAQVGVGSPTVGRAFTSLQPVLSSDPVASVSGERAAALRQAGIDHVVAVPAVFEGETLGVLEFLAPEPVEATERLTRALYGIGHEVGYFLSRRRNELGLAILSLREIEVLQLAASGQAVGEIAAELHLSPATIKRHFERAYARLGVSDRAAAVGEAMRRGLIR